MVVENGETSWGAYVPDLPGCVAGAETEEEVKRLLHEAIVLHLEDVSKRGTQAPQAVSKSDYVDIPLN